jgi:RNA polymerase-binding transcription factor DksA
VCPRKNIAPRDPASEGRPRAALAPILLRFRDMDTHTLQEFRRTLLERRLTLLQRWRQALADENELLAAREPDWEDTAAAVTAASVLEGIGEAKRNALTRIQSSLARIERGTYGKCAVCRGEIDEDRLRAVPETDRCGLCVS